MDGMGGVSSAGISGGFDMFEVPKRERQELLEKVLYYLSEYLKAKAEKHKR